ncbi:hypothetical protein DFR29_107281 [Tahibacter aquaticus]|uniref:Fibronectin type-III domain-containing protein n=1 Tax=Tahibacter aquaticus TaxID=520092 RepID=A0A4R6YWR4_9GAMM|nr:hypothetical protein [Tahibacter aquaticus]TDR43268.1 hypothetical protein DFR29_107281 [Tahibacter aquaticus]
MIPLLFASMLAMANEPSNISASPACEFGEIYQGHATNCLIEFSNRSSKPLRLSKLAPIDPKDRLSADSVLVPANGVAHVEIKIDTSTDSGTTHHPLKFRVEGEEPERYADSVGFVASVFDLSRLEANLGTIALAEANRKPYTLTFSSDEDPDARIEKVLSAPEYLNVSPGADGRSVQVSVRDTAPWGLFESNVILKVRSIRQDQVFFKVKGDVHGAVVPGFNPLELDLVRRGEGERSYRIPLRQAGDKPLRLGAARLEGMKGSVKISDCEPAAVGCRWLNLKISDQQPLGYLKGRVYVELPDYGKTLPIQVWGVMLSETTQVKDAAEEMKKAEASTVAAASTDAAATGIPGSSSAALSPTVSNVPIGQQLKRALTTAKPADPPGNGPVLRWEVDNEGLIYGYHVYRADSADGPWKRINATTLRVDSVEDAASHYAWRDESAEVGKTYWYFVGTLDHRGARKRLTSPSQVTVKPR